jgi:hypothetical protein
MWIMTQKTKPLGVGKLGQFELYYDTNTHTLYETFGDKRFRCGEMNKSFSEALSTIKPNKMFDNQSKQLDAPF